MTDQISRSFMTARMPYQDKGLHIVFYWVLRILPCFALIRLLMYFQKQDPAFLRMSFALIALFFVILGSQRAVKRGHYETITRLLLAATLIYFTIFTSLNIRESRLYLPSVHLFINLTLFQMMAFFLEAPRFAKRWCTAGVILYNAWSIVYLILGIVPLAPSTSALLLIAPTMFLVIESRILAYIVSHLRENIAKAEEASHTKGRFLAGTSHELRTPLNAIIGYAELAEEEMEHEEFDFVKSDLQKIQQSARHLLLMIDGILELSELEQGQLNIQPEPFALPPLLQSLQTQATNLAATNHNTLDFHFDDSVDTIVTDAQKLEACLLRLLDNAAKYTQQGTITFHVSTHTPGTLLFEIADTGEGMSEAQQQKVFEDFWQSSPATRNQQRGTGLGLTIARTIWEALGGTMKLHSTPQEGTNIQLLLPITHNQPHEAHL